MHVRSRHVRFPVPLTSALAASALVASALVGAAASAAAQPAAAASSRGGDCQLGHGVQHVISLVFDNVHFFRDNPNVPSDLEQMPHLLNFLDGNGTVMSNTHTPLIAHTADDSLSIYTGLNGDRHGQPVSNSYKTYNPDGTTDPAGSFAYWTDPVYDTASTPTAGHDTTPSMVYSPTVPAKAGATGQQTPAPWVPFARAGCSVGDFSTANMVLENTRLDLPSVFGANSPEVAQYNADSDPFHEAETADYVGVGVHCAQHDRFCASARGIKYGQTAPSPTAVTDALPTEPGGYHGYQALFGARYVAGQLGAGTPNLQRHGYPVTDANGNLTDINGVTMRDPYNAQTGFPGFSPTAAQSLAYLADMQENGVPVTYGYISDIHERKAGQSGCTTATAAATGNAVGPGDSCYVNTAQQYDQAFAKFFDRLQKDGITKTNTLFLISAEENDQFAGANVGRQIQPTPAGCDGVTVPCHYTAGQIGELQTNIYADLAGTASSSTTFYVEPQGAAVYVKGQPTAADPAVRQLQRDTADMTADDPYTGVNGEKITDYQASALEQRVLHMQTADPLRTPTYTIFPHPDYYFASSGPALTQNPAFAWNHGYYSPNIDITWSALVGPGVAHRGIDGPGPAGGNESSDPNSTHTVPQASKVGTWVDEVDLRPTLLHLAGLTDDYPSDGHVISQVLARAEPALTAAAPLAVVYQQLNSSVGPFATDTLIADTHALAGGSAGDDSAFTREQRALLFLVTARDALAAQLKAVLAAAAAGHAPAPWAVVVLSALGRGVLAGAQRLAG